MAIDHNIGSGSWTDKSTWDLGFVPGSSTDVVLDAANPATVTLTGNGSARTVVIANQNALALASGNLSAGRINVTVGGQLLSQTGTNDTSAIINQGGTVHIASNSTLVASNYSTDSSGGILDIADNATLQISGFSNIKNFGDILLSSTGGPTKLLFESSATFTTELNVASPDYDYSGGNLILSDSAANVVTATGAARTLHNVNNTISGAGKLGAGNMSFVNDAAVGAPFGVEHKTGDHDQGVIKATGTKNTLEIELGPANTLKNAGLIEAAGQAGLKIFTTAAAATKAHVQNSGLIQVDAGSHLTLARIEVDNTNGTITTSGQLDLTDAKIGNGKIAVGQPAEMRVQGSTAITDAIVDDAGFVLVDSGADLTLTRGPFNLGGGLSVVGKLTAVDTNLTVQTGGELAVFGTASTNNMVDNRGSLHGDGTISAFTFLNGTEGRVVGSLTLDIANSFDNHGSIDGATIKAANLSNSATISHATFADGAHIINQIKGVIAASSFGLLDVGLGAIEAIGTGQHVSFAGTNYHTGSLVSANGGMIDVKAAARATNLADVAIGSGSTFAIASGATLELENDRSTPSILDQVTISLANGSQATTLRFKSSYSDVPFVLQGGTISLSGSPLNQVLMDASFANANSTISGAGLITESRPDMSLGLDNRSGGIIEANGTSPLTLKLERIKNDGTFEADRGVLKVITSNAIDGGGTMLVTDGGTLDLSESKSFLGTFHYAGPGTILGPDVTPAGTIYGFATGDVYVFGLPTTVTGPLTTTWQENAQNTGGTLSIAFGAGQTYATLQLAGVYTKGDFSATLTSLPDGKHVAVSFAGGMHWAQPVDGTWQTAANWAPTGVLVPGPGDDALITVAGTPYTVSDSLSTTVRTVATGTSATLDIRAGTFTTTAGTSSAANAGAVKIGSGATFAVGGTFEQAATGKLLAGNGGHVDLARDATISGGHIGLAVGSTLKASDGSDTLRNVAIDDQGKIEIVNSGTKLTVTGSTISGTGAIDVGGGASLALTDSTVSGTGPIDVAKDGMLALGKTTFVGSNAIHLDGMLQIVGDEVLTGTIAMNAGSQIIGGSSPTTLTNHGPIKGAGTIGNSNLTLINDGTITPSAGGKMAIATGSNIVANQGTIATSDAGSQLTIYDRLDNASSGKLQSTAGQITTGRVDNKGLVEADGAGSTIEIQGGLFNKGTVAAMNGSTVESLGTVNEGKAMAVGSGSTLILGETIAATNSGEIAAKDGGKVTFAVGVNNVSGGQLVTSDQGVMEVTGAAVGGIARIAGTGSTLDLEGHKTASTTILVDFASGAMGELLLGNSANFAGSISGFARGDSIDIKDVAFVTGKDSYDPGSGQLMVTDGTHTSKIQLLGTYTASDFVYGDDSHGGTLVSYRPPQGSLPLVTHDDAYVMAHDALLNASAAVGVLFNDENAATATLKSGPSHGDLRQSNDGGFIYTPNEGFSGIDSFSYHAANTVSSGDAEVLLYVAPLQGTSSSTLNLLALGAEEQIAAIYTAFFDRGADAAGFHFWVGKFEVGLPTQGAATLFANIASSFGVSDEAKALYPFLANPNGASDAQIGAFLEAVYGNLFDRPADAAGLAYWTGQVRQTMAAGEFVGSVLVDIISGTQVGPDVRALMGKVAVSLHFVHEQEAHQMQWNGSADNAAATALLQEVTSDPQSLLAGIKQADLLIAAHA